MRQAIKLFGIILLILTQSCGLIGGTLGDDCVSDENCSSDYSCVSCSEKNTCYFSDSLTSESDYEWACTQYGKGSPTKTADTGNNSNNNSGNNTSSSSYNWSYTCPGGYGGGGEVPIPVGPCESQYKNYAKIYGCNDYLNFKSACIDLYGCLGQNTDTMCL